MLVSSSFISVSIQAQQAAKRGETQLENTILAVEHEKHIRKRVSRYCKTFNKILQTIIGGFMIFRSVSISNCIICHALVPNSDNVLLGSIDGTIFTFDQVLD
jgi:hypothetical protein